MTQTIAFFITPHGFGHASRATGLMQALAQQVPDSEFIVFSTIPKWFFQEAHLRVKTIPLQCDVGVVQKTPFIEDFETTLKELEKMYPIHPIVLDKISAELHSNKVNLVICDIAAIGILAAKQAGIPSVLIENFTWDWIYEPFINAYAQFKEFSAYLSSIYPRADLRIQTEPLCERINNAYHITSPIARQPFADRKATRKRLGIIESQKLVLMSMGGIQEEFTSAQKLQAYQDYLFIIPNGNEKFKRSENLIYLPHHSDFYHPDLIQAADFIVGKAGYSTVAEVFHAGIPFGFISRSRSRETRPLADFIKSNIPSIEISEEQYRSEEWLEMLPQIFALSARSHPQQNGAFDVIEILRSNKYLP